MVETPSYPWREAGLLWLRATAAYELFFNPIMSDGEWDELTRKLLDNYEDLDVYLRWAIPKDNLVSSTGSGIDWKRGLAYLAAQDVRLQINQSERKTK